MACRHGETQKHWYRSDRFFKANASWYFTTRENIDIGPFGSEQGARQGLDLFVQNVQSGDTSPVSAAAIALNGRWASTHYH